MAHIVGGKMKFGITPLLSQSRTFGIGVSIPNLQGSSGLTGGSAGLSNQSHAEFSTAQLALDAYKHQVADFSPFAKLKQKNQSSFMLNQPKAGLPTDAAATNAGKETAPDIKLFSKANKNTGQRQASVVTNATLVS